MRYNKMSYIEDVEKAFNNFLSKVCYATKSNLKSINGLELANAYIDSIADVKKRKIGNANGITGFSELLIQFLIMATINENFEPDGFELHTNKAYTMKSEHYEIRANRPLKGYLSEIREIQPDVVIIDRRNNLPILCVEIKTYLKDGPKMTINEFIKKYDKVLKDGIPVVLIIFLNVDAKYYRGYEEKEDYKNKLMVLSLKGEAKETNIYDIFKNLIIDHKITDYSSTK